MTPEKQTILEGLFWKMHEITSSTFLRQEGGQRVVTLQLRCTARLPGKWRIC